MSQIIEEAEQLNTEAVETAKAPEGIFGSLGIKGQLLAFQFINFALVSAILWFLILRPLVKKMEERRLVVNASLDKAKEIDTALAMSEIKFQERIDDAKAQANKIIEHSHADAEKLAEDMKAKAKREIQIIVDQAKKNIQLERVDMMDAVKKEAAELVVSGIRKILGEIMDEKKDKKFIEDALKKI